MPNFFTRLKKRTFPLFILLFLFLCSSAAFATKANRQLWVILGPHQDVLDGAKKWMDKYDHQIRTQADLLMRNTRIKYSVGNTWNLVHFLERNTSYTPVIKNLMKRGSFSSSAAWTGFEPSWFSGEFVQRNVFYSKKYLSSKLGYDSHWTQFNDVPSLTPQISQILAKSDVHLMMIHNLRMHYALNNNPYLYMVGLDGTKILTSTSDYDEALDLLDNLPVSVVRGSIKNTAKFGVSMLQAISDWGVEADASQRVLNSVNKWNKQYADKERTSLSIKTPEDFVNFALKKLPDVSLNSATGFTSPWPWMNFGNAYAMGVFAKAENLLPTAEKLSSICEILGFGKYPQSRIKKAWTNLASFADHNLDGTPLRLSYCTNAYNTSTEIVQKKLDVLGSKIKFLQDGVPVMFFNPLNWYRSGVVLVEANVPDKSYRAVIDQEGKEVPCQVLGYTNKRLRLLVDVKDVPPFGYTTYYISNSGGNKTSSSGLRTWENHIENRFFSIDADVKRGVYKVYDKKNRRDIVDIELGGDFFAPEARMFHYRHIQKRWTGYKPIIKTVFTEVKLAEEGPLRAVIRLKGFLDACPITMDWTIYRDYDHIDIDVTLDRKYYLNKINTVMNFPFNAGNRSLRIGVAYGSIPTQVGEVNRLTPFKFSRRSPDNSFFSYPYDDEFKNFTVGMTSMSFQKYFVIEDGGACLVVRQNFYNSRLARNGGKGILVGMPFAGVFPKNKKDSLLKYHYGIKTEKGDWRDAGAPKFGWEGNSPILYNVCKKGKGVLLETQSFLSVEPSESLILTTLKKNYDKSGYSIRFFENLDNDVDARIRVSSVLKLPTAEVSRSNLLEDPQTVLFYQVGKELNVPVKGFGIETVGFYSKKLTDITPPTRITDLKVTSVSSKGASLEWTAPGNDGKVGTANKYFVKYSEKLIKPSNWSAAKPYGDIKAPARAGRLEAVTLTGLKASTTFYVGIVSKDKKNNASPLSNVVTFTTEQPDNVAPSIVTGIKAKAISSSVIRFDWTAPGDDRNSGKVSGYRVYTSKVPLDKPSDFKKAKYALYGHPDASAGKRDYFKALSLAEKTTYYTYIIAFDEAGNSSPPSDVAIVKTRATKKLNITNCVDTTISGVNPEEMREYYNKEAILRTWDVRNRAILIKFDFSSVPKNAVVSEATLKLYNLDIVYADKGRFSCYPIKRKWDARYANWSHATKNVPWKSKGGDIDISGSLNNGEAAVDEVLIAKKKRWVSLDVTALVKAWLSGRMKNYGMLLAGAPESEFIFSSSSYRDKARRPYIEIKY